MLSLTVTLLVSAAPQLELASAELHVALVPLKTGVDPAAVEAATKKGWQAKLVPRETYAGLESDSLEHTANQLPTPERKQLAQAKDALAIKVTWKTGDSKALRDAYEALAALAQKHGAIIYDRNAASAFTVADWRKRHVSSGWTAAGAPIGPMHFQVHVVPLEGGLFMLDTGGMPRFGIADFEVLQVNRRSIDGAGNLVNVIAQRLIEGARPDAKGRLVVRLADVKEDGLRERNKASSYPNAKGELQVVFIPADVKLGAREDCLELSFPECTGRDRGERLDCAMKLLFGTQDSVSTLDSEDPRVAAARTRARTAFKSYEARVKKGLPHGEALLVKAPFPYGKDGTEWMWVDVQAWNGVVLRGRLENEPTYATQVRAGATVDVKLEEVLDYMYRVKDGSFFGNEIGRVMYPEMFEDAGRGRVRTKPTSP